MIFFNIKIIGFFKNEKKITYCRLVNNYNGFNFIMKLKLSRLLFN